ncbi:MAG: adenosylmethionine-8-amino-7-oxononanoate aminotransferase [Chlamydiales bacterium]|jgi:adenosylmethionine-8-amino-7-oxononanoate aminotransferase|nr:adenosylmethionine-8-amino-7-oxononanoate aminotransferase [Chlamydiales bacterium]
MVPFVKPYSEISEKDRAYIWHPFTQIQTALPPIPIREAKGIYLYTEEGKVYLDGISSWWVNLHGHSHPYIAEKIASQLKILEHVIFADFTHSPAVELATRLIHILPGKFRKVFYSDNGSTAVEAALKIALQYWYNKNPFTTKKKVVCFKDGYHGDTFGAMSAAGKNGFNKPFWSHLFEVDCIDPPIKGNEETSLSQLRTILQKGETACFIFEPLVLGSGGMLIYSAEILNELVKLCNEYNTLTIADEVMTGFGRTETLFACESLTEKIDIICLSKGLTGGFLPLGATICTQEIFEAFIGSNLSQAFLHGHSYTANPIACCSALASLDLLLTKKCDQQRKMIAQLHQGFCKEWKGHPLLKRCESLGTILALEYCAHDKYSYFQPLRDKLYHFFLAKGILLRPLGNVLYVLPPYCIQSHELDFIYNHIIQTLEGDL